MNRILFALAIFIFGWMAHAREQVIPMIPNQISDLPIHVDFHFVKGAFVPKSGKIRRLYDVTQTGDETLYRQNASNEERSPFRTQVRVTELDGRSSSVTITTSHAYDLAEPTVGSFRGTRYVFHGDRLASQTVCENISFRGTPPMVGPNHRFYCATVTQSLCNDVRQLLECEDGECKSVAKAFLARLSLSSGDAYDMAQINELAMGDDRMMLFSDREIENYRANLPTEKAEDDAISTLRDIIDSCRLLQKIF